MNDAAITAVATGLLVAVGLAQVIILKAQKRQSRLEHAADYRKRWHDFHEYWGRIVFIGRGEDEYYQVVDESSLERFRRDVEAASLSAPTVWARDSVRIICGIMSDVAMRILQGQLKISDAYPIFGTELLRHSRPLRKLLDPTYKDSFCGEEEAGNHTMVRQEIKDWLIYHDGLRRRCMILIDLLWAEAARLEDLPPSDMRSAADAKKKSGAACKKRVFREAIRLNGIIGLLGAWNISRFLGHSEYRNIVNPSGIDLNRLEYLETKWIELLLDHRERKPLADQVASSNH